MQYRVDIKYVIWFNIKLNNRAVLPPGKTAGRQTFYR